MNKKIRFKLSQANPKLASEWHPKKNENLTPNDVMPNSGKKVWWLCKKGHEWEMRVADRNKGYNCPYCSGKRATKENCLATVNPQIAHEWHPNKNGSLTPFDVLPFSNKKVWWVCQKGHEWETKITYRSLGHGCPFCVGQKVNIENCLASINPDLAKEWHPTKNEFMTPFTVTSNTQKKVVGMYERP